MRALAGLAAFLAVGALAACGGSSDDTAAPPTTPSTSSTPASADRDRAPAIAGQSLDGEAIALGDVRGRPVLVNVWSSW